MNNINQSHREVNRYTRYKRNQYKYFTDVEFDMKNFINSKSTSEIQSGLNKEFSLFNSINNSNPINFENMFDSKNKNFVVKNQLFIKETLSQKNKRKSKFNKLKKSNIFDNSYEEVEEKYNFSPRIVIRKENKFELKKGPLMIDPIQIDELIKIVYMSQELNSTANNQLILKNELPDKIKKSIFKEVEPNPYFNKIVQKILREVEVRNSKNKLVSKEYIANLIIEEVDKVNFKSYPKYDNSDNFSKLPDITLNKFTNYDSAKISYSDKKIRNLNSKIKIKNSIFELDEESDLSHSHLNNSNENNKYNEDEIKIKDFNNKKEIFSPYNSFQDIGILRNSLSEISVFKNYLNYSNNKKNIRINNILEKINLDRSESSKFNKSIIINHKLVDQETSTKDLNIKLDLDQFKNEINKNYMKMKGKSEDKINITSNNNQLLKNKKDIKQLDIKKKNNLSKLNNLNNSKKNNKTNFKENNKSEIHDGIIIKNHSPKNLVTDGEFNEFVNREIIDPLKNKKYYKKESSDKIDESLILNKTLITLSSKGFSTQNFFDIELRKTITNIIERVQKTGTNLNLNNNYDVTKKTDKNFIKNNRKESEIKIISTQRSDKNSLNKSKIISTNRSNKNILDNKGKNNSNKDFVKNDKNIEDNLSDESKATKDKNSHGKKNLEKIKNNSKSKEKNEKQIEEKKSKKLNKNTNRKKEVKNSYDNKIKDQKEDLNFLKNHNKITDVLNSSIEKDNNGTIKIEVVKKEKNLLSIKFDEKMVRKEQNIITKNVEKLDELNIPKEKEKEKEKTIENEIEKSIEIDKEKPNEKELEIEKEKEIYTEDIKKTKFTEEDQDKFKISLNGFIKTDEEDEDDDPNKIKRKKLPKKSIMKKFTIKTNIFSFDENEKVDENENENEKIKNEELKQEIETIIKNKQVGFIRNSINIDSLLKYNIINEDQKEEIMKLLNSDTKDKKKLAELLNLLKMQNEVKKKNEIKLKKSKNKIGNKIPTIKTEENLKQEIEMKMKAEVLKTKLDSVGIHSEGMSEALNKKKLSSNLFDVDSFLSNITTLKENKNQQEKLIEYNADEIEKNISKMYKDLKSEEMEIVRNVIQEERMNFFLDQLNNFRIQTKKNKEELSSHIKLVDVSQKNNKKLVIS